jgi:hypothetical protein
MKDADHTVAHAAADYLRTDSLNDANAAVTHGGGAHRCAWLSGGRRLSRDQDLPDARITSLSCLDAKKHLAPRKGARGELDHTG